MGDNVTITYDSQTQRVTGVSVKNSTITASPAVKSEQATAYYFENVIFGGNGVDGPVNGTYFFTGCDFKSGSKAVLSGTGQVIFWYPIDCTIDGQPATADELEALCNCPAMFSAW